MKLGIIAGVLGCSIAEHEANVEITRIASLEDADSTCITFLSKAKFLDLARASKAVAIIVQKGGDVEGKINCPVDDPYLGYAKVGQLFENTSLLFEVPVHPTAVIDPTATVHPSVAIGPLSVIGPRCVVGEKTIIGSHCVIERDSSIGSSCRIDSGAIIKRDSVIGNRVIIQSGTVIGSEGFGNAVDQGVFVRIPCFGTVVIEDDVEIGANVTVDRGNFQPTRIGKGTRIDNLVQIAHNVEIGQHTAMAAQVGISGSTKIGNHVIIAGQVGFVGHIEIGDGAFIGAQAGVSKSVKPGQQVTGYPARELMKVRRSDAALQELPQMLKEFKKLRTEVETLKAALNAKPPEKP